MPSPVAHALAGAAVLREGGRNWHNAGAAVTEALFVGVPVSARCGLRLRRRAGLGAEAR